MPSEPDFIQSLVNVICRLAEIMVLLIRNVSRFLINLNILHKSFGKDGKTNGNLLGIISFWSAWRMLMKDANCFLQLARRCRELRKTATEEEVVEQLRIWTAELAEMAKSLECRAVQHEMAD
jgi:hypothetical protein